MVGSRKPEAGSRKPSVSNNRAVNEIDLSDAGARDAFLRRLARLTCRPGIREDVVQGAHLEYLTHLQAGRRVDSIGGLCRSMMLKAVRLEVRWWRINRKRPS